MGRFPLALLLALGSAVPSFGAGPIQVLVPRDKAVVREGNLTVLGTAPRGTEVRWSVQKKSGREEGQIKADWGDLFEVFVLLEPGVNRVRIDDRTVEVFYAIGKEPIPQGFAAQRVHSGDISRCDDCHDPLNMRLREGGYPGVCLACHVVVSGNPANTRPAREDAHFRTAIANCGSCHEAHVSGNPKLLRAEATPLCGTCHSGQTTGKDSHPAFEEGGCAACHDAHYSGYAKDLHEPLPGLCHRCHDNGKTAGKAKPHPPMVQKGACRQCHEPHGTAPDLPRGTPAASCGSCHGEVLKHGHQGELADCSRCHDPHRPLGTGLLKKDVDGACAECHDGIAEGKTVHAALEEGCGSCHDPHSDENRKRAAKSCSECHDLAGEQELASLHGSLNIPAEACVSCHRPHASAREKLLKGKPHEPLVKRQCAACHGAGVERSVKVDDAVGRCRICHKVDWKDAGRPHDPVSKGRCTACHDPHLSDQRAFLRKPEADLCRSCHKVAAAAGGRRLHEPAGACTDCHAAHGGRGKNFLAAQPPGLCLDCHDDPRASLGDGLHPALEDGCLVCHDPHAGFPPGLMKGASGYAACQECHEVPDLSKGRTLHTPVAACSECHRPHGGSGPKYLSAPPDEICLDCHDDPGTGAVVHPALEEGCRSCHDPHTGYSGANLVKPQKELCLECHDDPTANHKVPHPVGERGCAGCHDPHSSKEAKLLRGQGSDLCRRCHDFREKEPGRGLHEAAEACGDCHEKAPHGGDKPRFLGTRPPDLCLDCHDDPRRPGLKVHPALEEGCLACHDPHAGFRPGVLKGKDARASCLDCHDDPAAGKAVAHRPVKEGCASCHEPHASASPKFLRKTGNGLCRDCHDLKAHAHSIDAERGNSRFPASAGFAQAGPEYACVACHEPHGSANRRLFPQPEGSFCVACHRM